MITLVRRHRVCASVVVFVMFWVSWETDASSLYIIFGEAVRAD